MVNSLIRLALSNRLATVVLSMLLIVAGVFVTSTMSVDVFPDLTAPTVTVIVEGHGMAPEEMETLVTFPIEAAVNGAADVRRVRSATSVGLSVVWVEFEWGTDIYRARQTIAERLSGVTSALPAQVDPPVIAPISSIMGEIVFAALTSDRHDPVTLRTTALSDVRRRLLSVPGVSQVTLIGGDEKQYQVVLSPQRLMAYGLSVDAVTTALERGNENVAAGIVVRGGQESVVQGIGRIRSESDISETVVAVRKGTPIRVGQLGTVKIGAAIKRGTAAASFRGQDGAAVFASGVIIAIQKQPHANTLELTRRLDAVLDDVQASLPAGMAINKNLFRQANFIETSVRHTVEALRDGGGIVILIVLAFLASFRASVITLLAIPISLVVTLLVLKAIGASINTMTLGGMAIAIGALVDDAIIDVENIVRRLRENAGRPAEDRRPVISVVLEASIEVRAAVVFATVIILLVFAPLFFLSGVEGRLLRPLGIAFCVALGASMFTALTLTPVLSSYLLPRSRTVRSGADPLFVRGLKWIYAPVLGFAMRHPWIVAVPTVALFAVAIAGLNRAGRNFLPEFNEGALVVGIVTLPGTSLDESDALARLVEQTLMRHAEIIAIGRRTGRAEGDEHVQGVEASEIDLTLDLEAGPRAGLPRRSKGELLEALRRDLATIPGVQATFGQPIGHRIDHMLSGTRANIAVKIFGEDLNTLRRLARQVEDVMRPIPGVVDLSSEQQTTIPTLRVEFDRQAMARHGLDVSDIAETLEAAFGGRRVTEVIDGRNTFGLVVRVGGPAPDHVEMAGNIPVDTRTGAKVPLRVLARISEEMAPNLISRENAQRKIVVMCNVAGRDMRGVVDDTRRAMGQSVPMPPGYSVEFGGQFETAEETNRLLMTLGLVVILGIGMILHLVFRSMRDALLIMVNLPLALIGGAAGVWLGGGVLSVASLIGFVTVFGIAARNGILMVSHIRHLERAEKVSDFREAVRRGALERLAPILMTALAAGLALVPIAARGGQPGTEILTPMAIVILCGLMSSTFLNMVVVPALFVRFGRPFSAALAGGAPEPAVDGFRMAATSREQTGDRP